MRPTVWTFTPWVDVAVTAYRRIAPAAISAMQVPVLIARRPATDWGGRPWLFTDPPFGCLALPGS